MFGHEFYIILNYISVLIMAACTVIVATHSESKMQKYALLVCISLLMCCIGFLFRAEGKDASSLILGQKLIYAFVTHGMYLMLLFILEYCKFKAPKIWKICFHVINFIVSIVVLTLDYHKLFYKRYWAEPFEDYYILEKEYGFMHTVAVGLFALYMIAALTITIIFAVKNIRKRSKYVWRILFAVMIPCISYFIPKLTDSNNDLQPFAFAAFSSMVILMIYKNNLYDVDNIALKYSLESMNDAIIVLDNNDHYKGSNNHAASLFPVLSKLNLDCDIKIEAPILEPYINGDTIEYRNNNDTYSVEVNKVYEGTIAEGKVIYFNNVTLERRYTDVLKKSKNDLELMVKTLSDYSYTDELTGLKNRRAFEENVNVIRKENDYENIIIGSADLNGLKKVNDTVGHAAGDELIKGAADILYKVFSKYGDVYRTGGDEYMIIMNETSEKFDNLISELEKEENDWVGTYSHNMSISLGFAFGNKDGDNIDKLIINADKIMYENKNLYHKGLE